MLGQTRKEAGAEPTEGTRKPHNQVGNCYCSMCETCYSVCVKTITIRDLRQRWPETEKSLQIENEILITRDGQPVAKLVRVVSTAKKRPRWNVDTHARWQRKVSGGKISRSDVALAHGRADRVFTSKGK